MKTFIRTCLAAVATALISVPTVQAEEWEYGLKPYFWSPGFEASYVIDTNPPTEGESSFWDKFEGALLLQGYARRGDWTILGEFNYLKLGETYLPNTPVLTSDVGLDGIMIGAGLGRRLYAHPKGFVELFGGLRYWDVELTAQNRVFNTIQLRRNWVDPIIGMRGAYKLNDKISFVGRADVGGFGVGSDFQADVQGAVSWGMSETTSFELGYRHLFVDFKDSRVIMDATMSGPYVALDFAF